ncbi:hypothetical protein M433DRAFT_157552 [Acidomyces richmondensis BFW]|nr:hypothetical protein M433DRAFT_157552 [Acidomyces richmondensis BFW]
MDHKHNLKVRFDTISKGAVLDIILPQSPPRELLSALKDGTLEDLRKVTLRRNLFFDEQAEVYIVLTATSTEDELQCVLPSLELALAAHATDAVPQGTGNAASASGKHDITSTAIKGADGDIVTNGDRVYVVWKSLVHLTRPRARLQRPAVYFTANITLSSAAFASSREPMNEFLTPYEPLPGNVLAALHRAPEFRNEDLYLSEDRINKVAPKPLTKDDNVKPIRGTSKRAFPTLPALFTRIRYNHVPFGVIASLHIEPSQVIAGSITIDRVELEVPNANSTQHRADFAHQFTLRDNGALLGFPPSNKKYLSPVVPASVPIHLSPGDENVLLYQLDGKTFDGQEGGSLGLSISINASVKLDDGKTIPLDISWKSQCEIPFPPKLEKTYQWSRPLSSTTSHHTRLSTASLQRSGSLPGSSEGHQKTAHMNSEVTFYFDAPANTKKDHDFSLKVKCINNSSRSRRLCIVPVQLKSTPVTHRKQPSSTRHNHPELLTKISNVPERESEPEKTDIQCLTPDVRIGPLPAGACFETQIDFRVTDTGVLNLGIIRVVDLDSRQVVDISDLPDIIATDVSDDSQPFRVRTPLQSSPFDQPELQAWREKEWKIRNKKFEQNKSVV